LMHPCQKAAILWHQKTHHFGCRGVAPKLALGFLAAGLRPFAPERDEGDVVGQRQFIHTLFGIAA
jgi:hypothetical protein